MGFYILLLWLLFFTLVICEAAKLDRYTYILISTIIFVCTIIAGNIIYYFLNRKYYPYLFDSSSKNILNYSLNKNFTKYIYLISQYNIIANISVLIYHLNQNVYTKKIKAIIIYGSFLYSRNPKDIDCLVVVENDAEIKNKHILIPEKGIIYKKEEYLKSVEYGSFTSSGCGYETRYKTVIDTHYNPLLIDMGIHTEEECKKNISVFKSGESNQGNDYNAFSNGVFLYKRKDFHDLNTKSKNLYKLKLNYFKNKIKVFDIIN